MLSLGVDAIWSKSYVHISEVLLLCFFLVFFITQFFSKEKISAKISSLQIWSVFGVMLSLFLAYLFAADSFLHILHARYLIEGFLLFFILISNSNLQRTALFTLLGAASLEACLMVIQFIIGSNIGLSFLKEPVFSASDLTSAKFYIFGKEHIRSYGTFLHPNIASAYLLATLFVFLAFRNTFSFLGKWQTHIIASILFLGILSGVSKTAYFILLFLGLLWLGFRSTRAHHIFSSIQKRFHSSFILEKDLLRVLYAFFLLGVLFALVVGSVFFFFNVSTITERLFLFKSSLWLLFTHPFGIGLGNFILFLHQPNMPILFPWEYQPVHSAFMLIGNELGIIGGVSYVLFFGSIFLPLCTHWYMRKKISFALAGVCLTIFCYACIDHFWVTSWTASIGLSAILAIVESYSGRTISK